MPSHAHRIAIFASGNGSNAEAIIQYFKGHKSIKVALVLSNNPDAYVLERAKAAGIPAHRFTREEYKQPGKVLEYLSQGGITHIVLAGFLWLVPEYLIKSYRDRIVNIHPALLPKFGGKGMYGSRVHEAVKLAGEKETGITIHLVNEHYDEGRVLFQKSCPVETHFSAMDIAKCVLLLEHKHYPEVIEKWVLG
ncbi:MAG TPA: phosphoribosylglycinamide formyltransferase [Chryseosolibacter sp.]